MSRLEQVYITVLYNDAWQRPKQHAAKDRGTKSQVSNAPFWVLSRAVSSYGPPGLPQRPEEPGLGVPSAPVSETKPCGNLKKCFCLVPFTQHSLRDVSTATELEPSVTQAYILSSLSVVSLPRAELGSDAVRIDALTLCRPWSSMNPTQVPPWQPYVPSIHLRIPEPCATHSDPCMPPKHRQLRPTCHAGPNSKPSRPLRPGPRASNPQRARAPAPSCVLPNHEPCASHSCHHPFRHQLAVQPPLRAFRQQL